MTGHAGGEKHQKTVTYASNGAARRIRPWIAMAVAGAVLVLAAARAPAEVSAVDAAASLAEAVGPAPDHDCEGPVALPPGHPPVGQAMPLPPGHPPIQVYERPALPPGHPPVSRMPRLPAGHPAVDHTMNEAAEYPPGFLTTL